MNDDLVRATMHYLDRYAHELARDTAIIRARVERGEFPTDADVEAEYLRVLREIDAGRDPYPNWPEGT